MVDTRISIGAIGVAALLLVVWFGVRTTLGLETGTVEAVVEPSGPPTAEEAAAAQQRTEPATVLSGPADVLRMGVLDPVPADPAAVTGGRVDADIVADLLYDGLTTVAPGSTEVEPALAESFEASDDGLTWRFRLRQDATFSDGTPVDADDVIASFERVAAGGAESLVALRLESVSGFEEFAIDETTDRLTGLVAQDPFTVDVNLTEPFADLPALLAGPSFGVAPESVAPGLLLDGTIAPRQLATSGPMKVVAVDEDSVVLRPVDPGSVGVASVYLERYTEADAAFDAFVDGELDWAMVPSTRVDEDLSGIGRQAFSDFHAELFYALELENPTFADRRFRRAIVHAVDRDAIVAEVLGEGATALDGVVPGGLSGYRGASCAGVCDHDPDAAERIVNGLYPDGDVPTISVDTLDGDVEEAVAEAVAADLEAVGIPTEVRVLSLPEFEAAKTAGELELYHYGWVGSYPSPDAYLGPNFASTSLDNGVGLASDVVDEALAAARSTEDLTARLARYAGVEEEVLRLSPIVPIAQLKARVALSDRVGGYSPRLDGTFPIEAITIGQR
ncbi:MAG: ABC transporter substrate-binding protein [Actinomycetota bacterium]|nr:ABC transporter substrate-binding protein [Actinomycetota bacterium]